MAKRQARRQRIRKALLIISFILLPVVLNYLSPYLIIDGASQGVINGSFVTFTLLFLSALFLGRLWCGWVCPTGGFQEICFAINDRPARGGKLTWIKYAIWIPWLGIIAAMAISAGGYHTIDVLYLTESGISVDRPAGYIIYYMVLGLLFTLAVVAGKRAGCRYICWMAPFMILGRKIRNLFKWPALRLTADTEQCINCKKCTAICPMSLDVNGMVQAGEMENSECILCASCIDVCPKDVIHYTFSAGK
jgi:ferredoxin-type protein NapH